MENLNDLQIELEKKDRIINELLLCMKNPKQVWNCSNITRRLVEKGWNKNIPFLRDHYHKPVRVPEFDMVGDSVYGDTPYGVCLDVYDYKGNFVESGTDWKYFATEDEAEKYIEDFVVSDLYTTIWFNARHSDED